MTTSYDTLNNLDEFSFIAGTDKVLTFTCYDENALDLLNITGGSAYWWLCPFGESSVVTLSKTGNITDANTFTVTLTAADTLYLSGKYIQQTSVTDYVGNTFRAGQGTVIILPAITT